MSNPRSKPENLDPPPERIDDLTPVEVKNHDIPGLPKQPSEREVVRVDLSKLRQK